MGTCPDAHGRLNDPDARDDRQNRNHREHVQSVFDQAQLSAGGKDVDGRFFNRAFETSFNVDKPIGNGVHRLAGG